MLRNFLIFAGLILATTQTSAQETTVAEWKMVIENEKEIPVNLRDFAPLTPYGADGTLAYALITNRAYYFGLAQTPRNFLQIGGQAIAEYNPKLQRLRLKANDPCTIFITFQDPEGKPYQLLIRFTPDETSQKTALKQFEQYSETFSPK
jgi:hypothetical protein